MSGGLFELAVIIVLAAVLGYIARVFKQPLIVAYLLTGALVALAVRMNLLENALEFGNHPTFHLFSDLGIMFLLFLVGLEVNYHALRLVGPASLVIGVLQILITSFVGYGIALLLGFSSLHAFYLGISLTFSSTIVIVKLLSEKKELNSLYGRITIGLLLVQDFVAVLLLVALSSFGTGEGVNIFRLTTTVLEGVLLFGLMIWLGKKIIPSLLNKFASSQELLFISSLAWVFAVAVLVHTLGFSIEIGGLLAGVALANASEHYQIASRVRSLRDFFILMFFVLLGSSLVFADFANIIFPVLALSAFVLIGNMLIVLIVMGLLGYRLRTSFFTSISIAQISEFSLVLATLGFNLGHISEREVSIITTVGIVSIIASSYMILHGDRLFQYLRPYLKRLERRKHRVEEGFSPNLSKKILLIGFTRTGQSIATHLSREDLLIIDQDPEIIRSLREHGFSYMYGDASDDDLLDIVNLEKTELLISTVPTVEETLALLEQAERINRMRSARGESKIKIIVRAEHDRDAVRLYRRGADYVFMPHLTSGHYLGSLLASSVDDRALETLKNHEMKLLNKTIHETMLSAKEVMILPSREFPIKL